MWRNQGEVPMEWEKCRRCLVCSQTRAVIGDMRGMCYRVNAWIETQRRIFSCLPTHSPGDLDKWHNLRGPVLTSFNTVTVSPSTFQGCRGSERETRQRCFKTVFPPSGVFLKLSFIWHQIETGNVSPNLERVPFHAFHEKLTCLLELWEEEPRNHVQDSLRSSYSFLGVTRFVLFSVTRIWTCSKYSLTGADMEM